MSGSRPRRPEPSRDATGDEIATVPVEGGDGVKLLSASGPGRPEPSRDATGDEIATVNVEVHGVKVA